MVIGYRTAHANTSVMSGEHEIYRQATAGECSHRDAGVQGQCPVAMSGAAAPGGR
jgi:hypothetical protein